MKRILLTASIFLFCVIIFSMAGAADSSFRVAPLLVMETLAPGDVLSDRLVVTNPSEEPMAITVTPRDFTTNAEGKETWFTFGSDNSSLKNWLSFTPSYQEIPPGGEAYIDYEIVIPENELGTEPPTGARWGSLAVRADRGRRTIDEGAHPESGTDVGVKVALVYAVKIFVSVAGAEERSLKALQLLPGDTPGSLDATFANRGGVVLRPRVWMEVRDLDGAVLGTVEALKWTLPPSGEHRYKFDLKDFPDPLADGSYQIVVIADYEGDQLEGMAAPLVLKSGDNPKDP